MLDVEFTNTRLKVRLSEGAARGRAVVLSLTHSSSSPLSLRALSLCRSVLRQVAVKGQPS